MMYRYRLALVAFVSCWVLSTFSLYGAPPSTGDGDYDGNGIVDLADYDAWFSTFGSTTNLSADGNRDGIVGYGDYPHLGGYDPDNAPPAMALPFSVVVNPVGSNLQWTFTFNNVNGALAGHVNITTNGPPIVSVTGGPSLLDDGFGAVGVPGTDSNGIDRIGTSKSGSQAFVALGTTLPTSPAYTGSSSTLEFFRLVTEGIQPTTISFAGEYGYQGQEFALEGSASYGTAVVPEATSLLIWTIIVAGTGLIVYRQHCRGLLAK